MKEKLLQFDTRKDIFWTLTAVIGVCMCLYIYCITATVRNVVNTRHISLQAGNVSQQISSQEFAVIDMQSKITPEYAQSLGFVEAKDKTFISPTSVSVISKFDSNN